MTPVIILDSDFLSAMLKIGRSELIRAFYQVQNIHIAPAVHREIAQTTVLSQLLSLPWVVLTTPEQQMLETLRQDEAFSRLGAGDQESIASALATENSHLLTNDNRCRQIAATLGVTVINIPALLLACKMSGQLTTDDLRQIIDDLWRYDHYKFRQDVQARLLT